MELSIIIFLLGGLFLGWSLGANDAANVFGTAVGTRMMRFRTAAIICSIFVILGAIISGSGTTETLGKLGAINALPGAFAACVAAGLSVYLMTRFGLPVSTTQAIVGAIVGWNIYTGSSTNTKILITILSTWILCPIIAGLIAMFFYVLAKKFIHSSKLHILRLDAYTRAALILAGAFGAYSLGANNIANVMGVFVPISPFTDINVMNIFIFSSKEQLFLLGGIAIAIGVFTYSRRVMFTVGNDLSKMSPVAAFIVVISHSIVLFLFASQGISNFLQSINLPSIPLVPVSSSQAVVGAVIGIGLLKGGKEVRWSVAGKISLGWVTLPVIAALMSFMILFILQNIFNLTVNF
jgi:PiT family inorganic phosphate transporter|tara:strand:+ start:1144 stop:2196 length:1053 start_codon:yes stop_codon:yes gene_type:complete